MKFKLSAMCFFEFNYYKSCRCFPDLTSFEQFENIRKLETVSWKKRNLRYRNPEEIELPKAFLHIWKKPSMPQFDQETMVKLVSELRKNVTRLQNLSRITEAEFLKDPDKIGSAKYHSVFCTLISVFWLLTPEPIKLIQPIRPIKPIQHKETFELWNAPWTKEIISSNDPRAKIAACFGSLLFCKKTKSCRIAESASWLGCWYHQAESQGYFSVCKNIIYFEFSSAVSISFPLRIWLDEKISDKLLEKEWSTAKKFKK